MPLDSSERTALAAELEAALRRDVLEPWFPRCLDHAHGGFLSDFDHAWRPRGPQHKQLEFQARQTWLAAHAALAYPADATYREAALHGFRYLRDVMWDRAQGGWFHRLTREGSPLEAETKHAHGMTYAIQACVAVDAATGERGAPELARAAFEWLERCAHDEVHGGYRGFLARDGSPITDRRQNPLAPADKDSIGTPVGLKDVNVHSDFVDALVDLYRAFGDRRVGARLAELVDIICDRMIVGNGALHMYFEADWRPVPDLVRYAYEVQSARRLAQAGAVLAEHAERTRRVSRLLVAHVLESGWDSTGGLCYAGSAFGPIDLDGQVIFVRDKLWWVQAETLHTLLFMALHDPDHELDYLSYFRRQWRWVREHLVDPVHHGWNHAGRDGGRWWRLTHPRDPARRKGHAWKDGSHEGGALMSCVRMLRGLPEHAPL